MWGAIYFYPSDPAAVSACPPGLLHDRHVRQFWQCDWRHRRTPQYFGQHVCAAGLGCEATTECRGCALSQAIQPLSDRCSAQGHELAIKGREGSSIRQTRCSSIMKAYSLAKYMLMIPHVLKLTLAGHCGFACIMCMRNCFS